MLSRLFVISLAIAIAITQSPASGFTIRRSQNVLDSTPDLETDASTHLEVRYDLKTSNDLKQKDISHPKGDTSVIAINETSNIGRKINRDENITVTTSPVDHISDNNTKISVANKLGLPSDTLNLISTSEITTNFYTTAALSTSQTTTRGPDKNEDVATKPTFLTSAITQIASKSLKEYSNDIVEENLKKEEIKENGTNTIGIQNNAESITDQNFIVKINFTEKNIFTDKNNVTEKPDYNNVTNNFTDDASKNDDMMNSSTTEDSYAARKDVARSISETTTFRNINTDPIETSTSLKTSDMENSSINFYDGNSVTRTEESLDFTTPAVTELEADVTKVTFEASTTEVDAITENSNTETVTVDFNPRTLPIWKQYTTIERKHTNSEGNTTSDKDMAKVETGQTRISLEKVLSNTPIPSLEKLRIDLMNAQESTTNMLDTTNTTESNLSSATDFETTASTQMMSTEIETETSKLEIVSKRAGYLDNTDTTTVRVGKATTTNNPSKVSLNKEMFGSMYETEPGDVEVTDHKNATGLESQSQLAEDAIKEELLREETLNDNEENAYRHRDERLTLAKVKPISEWRTTDDTAMAREIVTEDMLSVKPISHDKKKNIALYAVSPNYKPLKKIDVQPSKQFVRDPDDNSWRNESISSLGIVFKPKNASKSFTEVLKNKTETELSSMTEKDDKNDVPDLRVRLEKITEVRKSKKKKINKFGDTVYSDYEESGENVNSLKEYVTTPMSPSFETPSSTLSLPSNSSTTEFDLTVNAISKENIDLFKNEGTTPLTTGKPKKFYNLAEYYDTTDEYDADYVNLSKIDLKKFTQPYKGKETSVTQPPELLRTKPMKEYQPERKATVQYFPPTQKVTQKVNLNDYDADFNRKVNLYTFKEPPQKVLSVSYGTVSPVQTGNYEHQNKLTVKPAFTPMYKTANLDKNLYLTNQPRTTEPPNGFIVNDGNFNRASYVIKHYRDFINEAAKSDDDRSAEFLPYTESPLRGVTINELAKMTTLRDTNPVEEDYEYDVKFRKDIMNKFVDNFNQNSERFKVDFPILYNNSVVHRKAIENGKVLASSSAFMKRLYEMGNSRSNSKPCDPHCDNMTVELSPAYELHYYVPEQEEKEEMEPRPITVPYRYRL